MSTIAKKGTGKKVHFIWSNLISEMFPDEDEQKEMYKEFLEENELTEDDCSIGKFLYDLIDQYWDDEIGNLTCYENKHGEKYYLVLADLGFWNGRADGGLIIKGIIQTMYKCFEDYNIVKVEGKRMKISAAHHDGTHYFEIRELTDRGIEYWNNHPYMSDRELHKRLFNDSHYTHEVSIFKEVYGWK